MNERGRERERSEKRNTHTYAHINRYIHNLVELGCVFSEFTKRDEILLSKSSQYYYCLKNFHANLVAILENPS
jgi:hypothetical protein